MDGEPEEITPQLLLKAYTCGLFPMAQSAHDPELFWVEPDYRGIIPLEGFKIPRRLARVIRQQRFEIRIDTQFEEVVASCAKITPRRRETWINQPIRRLYKALFDMGHCHSVECWLQGNLAGGLYGVRLGGAFFGESMFSNVTDASKVALVHLVERLRAGGFILLDTQFVTGHLTRFGAIELPRLDYLKRLQQALSAQADFFSLR